jgi:uncharacterized protein YndB with AHSA1/START domain
MADIRHSVPIKAAPEAVYKAITEPGGLRSWWTTDLEAEAVQGGLDVFRFEGGRVQMRMRVKSLSPGKRVRWQVEEPAPPEWEGTEISWDLSETNGGTTLLFAHRGWKSVDNSFPFINYSWGYYLVSLVRYLEEGKGFPHDKPG